MAADFVVAGHVPPDSAAYVERDFVNECFAHLSGGRWVVLLGPRQHGKTSGLVRLMGLLREGGAHVARISFQGAPDVASYPELLDWLCRRVARQFGVELVPPAGAEASDLDAWLAATLPEERAQVVLVLDEAAGLKDADMRSLFYRQLRSLHDERDAPRVPNLGRAFTILFSGTFEPKRLVADDLTSPFNVSERIETGDLTLEEAVALVEQVGATQAGAFVDRAYGLVGGQPMLLQHLLAKAERGDEAVTAEERYEEAEAKLLMGDSDHVSDLLYSIVNDRPVRDIAREVLHREDGAPFVATPEHRMLVTLGFAHVMEGRLLPRNPLYARVAADHPMLSVEDRPAPGGVRVAPLGPGSFDFVADDYLRTFAEEQSEAGYDAYNGGHIRLALTGLGSALEAVLIDVLEQAGAAAVTKARNKAKNTNFSSGQDKEDPGTWRLTNLVEVAHELEDLGASLLAAHAIRELRNLVHPAADREKPVPQADLDAEFKAVEGVFIALVRDLGSSAPAVDDGGPDEPGEVGPT
jgi:AAA-like domain